MAACATSEREVKKTRWTLILGGLGLAVYLLFLMAATRSTFFGDTEVYSSQTAAALRARSPGAELLDFGHLVWRPLGALLAPAPDAMDGKRLRLGVSLVLIRINWIAAMVCALAAWVLLRQVKGIAPGAAGLACATFLSTNGMINLSRSGTAWLPGLACCLVGCCLAFQAGRRKSLSLAVCAAAFAASAVLLWVPYVLAAPAIACTALLAQPEEQPAGRVWWCCLRILPAAGLLTLAAFGAAAYARHIGSPPELLDWIRSAGHGEGRDRQLLRMFFGLPRSFLIMGDDGVLWKQFLFRDPYAGAGIRDILGASLPRLALFYAAGAAMLFELLRQDRTRRILAWVGIGAIPALALAVSFEAGSVERYLALYPAFFVALAWVLSRRGTTAASRLILGLFCCVLILNNLRANWKPSVDADRARMLARIGPVVSGAAARGKPAALSGINIRDELVGLYDPNDRSLDAVPALNAIVPPLAGDAANWRGLFARHALQAWQSGTEVWVAKRALADRPRREWLWVEGDDRRVRWKDVTQFVAGFEIDAEAGGPDGFCRLADSPANRRRASAPWPGLQ